MFPGWGCNVRHACRAGIPEARPYALRVHMHTKIRVMCADLRYGVVDADAAARLGACRASSHVRVASCAAVGRWEVPTD